MLICGIDLSTFRVDYTTVSRNGITSQRHVLLGDKKDHVLTRLRATLLPHPWTDPDYFVVEKPFGQGTARDALMAVTGAVSLLCPPSSQLAWISASEWRKGLGCNNTKAAGHVAVREYVSLRWGQDTSKMDEHELDSLGVALGFGLKYSLLD